MFVKYIFSIIISVSLYGGCNVKKHIPDNADKYLPIMYEIVDDVVSIDVPFYFGSLIEQESCVAICGKGYWARRCWSPVSELKTDREQGVGFGQITRAWRKDGTLRFDTLYSLKQKYPKELNDLTWENIKQKPDLQMKAIMLLWRDNYNLFNNDVTLYNKIAFADSIYNGGYKYFNYERSKCKLTKGCDPNIWFDNVAKMDSKRNRRKLYGNRTAWDINRDHVEKVLKIRLIKYKIDFIQRIDTCILHDDGSREFILKDTIDE